MAARKRRSRSTPKDEKSRAYKHQRDLDALNEVVQRRLIARGDIAGPAKRGWTWYDAIPRSPDGSPCAQLFLEESALLLDTIVVVTTTYESMNGLLAKLARRAHAAAETGSLRLLKAWLRSQYPKLDRLLRNYVVVNDAGIAFQENGVSEMPSLLRRALAAFALAPSISHASTIAELVASMNARVIGAGFYGPRGSGPFGHVACLLRERGLTYDETALLLPQTKERSDFVYEHSWNEYKRALSDAIKHRVLHAKKLLNQTFGDESALEVGARDLPRNGRWVVLFSARVESQSTFALTF